MAATLRPTREDQRPRAAWHLRLQAICLALGLLVSLVLVVATDWAPGQMWLYLISMAVASILAFQASRMQKPGDAGWWLAVVVEAALVAASVAVAVGTAAVARLNGAVWPCLILFFLATDDRRARRPIAE